MVGAEGWVQVGGEDQLSGKHGLPGIPVSFLYIKYKSLDMGKFPPALVVFHVGIEAKGKW